MLTRLLRRTRWIATGVCVFVFLVFLLAASYTWYRQQQEVDTVSDEQKLARTLEIIRTSTLEHPKVLKVLFYGQSITRSGWHTAVVDHWRKRYPNTVFVVENRAIGGFPSQMLVRTTEQDINAFYPDLIIFHVYGDHRDYERIIRLFRSVTAADILVQTDHGEVLPDPPCPDGLQMTLHRPPGCAGTLWMHQRMWSDEMSYHKIPMLARKYGLAVEAQRGWWRDYLLSTHTDPKALLADIVHPNELGKQLFAQFFNQYFDTLVDGWKGQTETSVTSFPGSETMSGLGHANFDGSRIELLTSEPLPALQAVTIDGSSPAALDGCYQLTRASSTGSVPDWPAVNHITLHQDHTPEEWTATVTNATPDQRSFEFTVKGSVSGEQGGGRSAQDFVSKSGQLSIEARDWMFARSYELKPVPLETPFEVHWSVNYVCGGSPEVIDLGSLGNQGKGAHQYRYVLATGLSNGPHTLALSDLAGDKGKILELRSYKPPLAER